MGNLNKKPKIVVVDADAIVAQANAKDSNHSRASKIAEKLNLEGARVLYPVTAVVEAATVIQSKMNSLATAVGTASVFTDPNYNIVEIDQGIYNDAINKYSKVSSKKDTLFDCIVAAVADKYKADAIFSFDKFYKRNGFKLASEL